MIDIIPLELSENPNPHIVLTADGIHCLCPLNGRVDTAQVVVSYTPLQSIVELASLRAYLESFADTQILHEIFTQTVFRDVREALDPRDLTVRTTWAPVEGIAAVVSYNTWT